MTVTDDPNSNGPPPPPVAGDSAEQRSWPLRTILYPACYGWFVFVSALDVVLTRLVLHMEGTELNVVAAWVIARWDLHGVVTFKFALVAGVICICEVVGRRDGRLGRFLAFASVGITSVPVALTLAQLFYGYAG